MIDVDGLRVRLVTTPDLVILKLAAAEEPKRRPSKREHDLGDILALIEEHPEIESAIPGLADRLQRIQGARPRLGSRQVAARGRLTGSRASACLRRTRRPREHPGRQPSAVKANGRRRRLVFGLLVEVAQLDGGVGGVGR